MKISINLPDDLPHSIMQSVLDGTLAVSSIEEFNEVLQIYPDDALLHRKYADLLSEKGLAEAVTAYSRAAQLFIERGMNLQAIVAKILQWSIQRPSHEQGVRFYRQLNKNGHQHTPLQRFWVNMSYPELVTFMLRLVRQHLKTGDKITQLDQPADMLYFVVSGTLAESPSEQCQFEASKAGIDIEPKLIGPNDIFGNIFPLGSPTVVDTNIEAVTNVELVKIAKSVLRDACRKHPRIARLLYAIHRSENASECDRVWQTVRRTTRFGLPTKVEIFTQTPQSAVQTKPFTGIALDISIGGMCIDIGPAHLNSSKKIKKGQIIQLLLDLHNSVAILDLTGKVVWLQNQTTKKGTSLFAGIRFDPLNATDRELLIEYCSGNVSEQNLLWGLWDTMIKPED